VRITIACLSDDEADAIASIIASVEHAGRPRRLY